MDYFLSSRFIYLFSRIVLLIFVFTSSAVDGVDQPSSSTASSSTAQPITLADTTFPPAQASNVFTMSTTTSTYNLKNLNVLLHGIRQGNSTKAVPDPADLPSFVAPQLIALARIDQTNDPDRIINVQFLIDVVTGAEGLRFTLLRRNNPTNTEAVNNIINLVLTQGTVVNVYLDSATKFELSKTNTATEWTDDSPCPVNKCPDDEVCNAAATGSLYCQANPVTTPVGTGNGKLGLIALIAIPIIISAILIGYACYKYEERKIKAEEEKIAEALRNSDKKQVYQNTLGKSYATVFNNKIFLKDENEDTPSEHKAHSTMEV